MTTAPHHHDHETELAGATEDPVASSSWLWIVVFVAVLNITVLAVTAVTYHVGRDEEERKVVDADYTEVAELERDQRERLAGTPHILEYVNELQEREQALVIPVERAMALVAAEYGQKGSTP